MPLNHHLELFNVLGVHNRLQVNHALVAQRGKRFLFVQNKGNTATHAGGKIPSCFAEYDNCAASHVFTTMVTNTLHNRLGSAVADGESFARNSAEKDFTSGGAIEQCVAHQNIRFRNKS